MTADFILEPYFFEEQEGNGALKTVTVNGQRYEALLSNFVLPKLREKPDVMEQLIFQQDGAPPHIYRPVKSLLRENFGNRIISRHFPEQWPPRSPDLNPLDFWLWGYLKSRVFQHAPQSIDELKVAIRAEISLLRHDDLKKAVLHFADRASAVIEQNGGHFEHLL